MTGNDFFERIKQYPLPVVVDFWAPWCLPCRAIEPPIKKLGTAYAGRVEVWKVNADEQPDVLRSLHIYGIPTLVAYHDGQEVSRRTGVASRAALSTLFEAALSGVNPVSLGPALLDRVLRFVAGAALFIFAFQGHFFGICLFVAELSVVIAFSAVYDHCPIYRALSARLKSWLHKEPANQPRP